MADKKEFELRPTAETVKKTAGEMVGTPVSNFGKSIEAFVQTVQKINDIADAKNALGKAKDLYTKGKIAESKHLVTSIFDRLKQIGKAPEGLDVAAVQQKLSSGKYEELAQSLEKTRQGTKTKNDSMAGEIIENVKSIEKKSDQRRSSAAKETEEQAKQFVETNKAKLLTEEADLQKELLELMSKVEKKAGTNIKKELAEMKIQIEVGMVGEVMVEKQIHTLRESVKNKVEQLYKAGEKKSRTKDKGIGQAAKNRRRNTSLLEKVAESAKAGKIGEKVFLNSNLVRLVKSLDNVSGDIKKGLGLTEAVRALEPEDIREIRTMLGSLVEQGEGDRSPYYDERYVDFIGSLGLGKDEILGIKKMLEAVDVHYVEQRKRVDTNQNQNRPRTPEPQRGGGARFADREMDMVDGVPTYGMDLDNINHDAAHVLHDQGRAGWDQLYEELPEGGFRPRNFAEQIEAIKRRNIAMQLQRNEQRESFLNINMQELFAYMQEYDKKNKTRYFEMIDGDYYREHQVAKLKDKYLSPVEGSAEKKAKDAFEQWWYQEAAFNQRSLAYEGLFERRNQSPRMQRLNSLMEIVGVGTEKKGLANWMAMSYSMIDQQNNSYVNAEFMGKLAGFWTAQGVDFRLEDMLKEFREHISILGKDGEPVEIRGRDGEPVTINVFDTLNFMQEYVPNDARLRQKLGIPDWWKGKWGTYIFKYSESGARGAARRGAWDYFLENKLGVKIEGNKKFNAEHQKEVSNKYQLMFDLSFNYAVAHKQLYQMLGNASFKKGEFELPAACAEMHLKLDPILYSRAFAPRYTWLNVAFKEGWALFDPGLRDYVTMAPQDYASHFTQFDKNNPDNMITDNGSPTIIKAFLIGNSRRSIEQADIQAATELESVFNKALWHWGAGKGGGHGHGKETDALMEWGVDGDKKSAFRRSSSEVGRMLLDNKPSKETLARIDWNIYCDIAKDPKIKKFLLSKASPEAKWDYFAKTFGEHSYNHATPSAKRSGDHPVKYGVESFNKYVETFLAWINDPFNQEKFDALMDVPTAINAGAVPGMAKKNLDFLIMMSERMGKRWLGGGKMHRLYRNPKDNTTKFDTSNGIAGHGDSEWPGFLTEEISNNKMPWDPIQHESIPGSVGLGIPKDKQILLDLIKGQRAKGRLPDDLYRHFYKEIVNSGWYESKLGPLVNAYNWLTLEPIFEWLGPQLGVTGHELRHVISENTEKTAEKFWHYLNGGGH